MTFGKLNNLGCNRKRTVPKLVVLGVLFCVSVFVSVLTFGDEAQMWVSWIQPKFVTVIYDTAVTEGVTEKPISPECPSGIVFARHKTGRLGNCFLEYASTWSVAKLYNMTPVVSDDILKNIKPLLTGLSAVPASKFIRNLRKTGAACAKLVETELLHGEPITVQPWKFGGINKLQDSETIILKPYMISVDSISALQSTLKEEFVYQPKFLSYAEKVLRNASRVLTDNTTSEGQITYVGVHVRRTDYMGYLHFRYGLEKRKLATVNYYVHAMQYMIKHLSDNGYFKVVFAVTSDDQTWCIRELIPAFENHLKSHSLLGKNATVNWCGSSDYRNDLVLLSSCNHSIISYGTYGTWGALMAGGTTVVFDVNANNETKKTNSAMNFAKRLPDWVLIH